MGIPPAFILNKLVQVHGREIYDALAIKHPLLAYLRDRTALTCGGLIIEVPLADGRVAKIDWQKISVGKLPSQIPTTSESFDNFIGLVRKKIDELAHKLHDYCIGEVFGIGEKYGGIELGDLRPRTSLPSDYDKYVRLSSPTSPTLLAYFSPDAFELRCLSQQLFHVFADNHELCIYGALVCHHPEHVIYVPSDMQFSSNAAR